MIIVADTSGLFAAVDESQPEHAAARPIMLNERLLISPLVLTELDHLVRRDMGFNETMAVIEAMLARMDDGQYRLGQLTRADLETAQQVRTAYPDLRLDLADAVGVALAHRYRTNLIFTLDQRDFRAVRPLDDRFESFRLLPADVTG